MVEECDTYCVPRSVGKPVIKWRLEDGVAFEAWMGWSLSLRKFQKILRRRSFLVNCTEWHLPKFPFSRHQKLRIGYWWQILYGGQAILNVLTFCKSNKDKISASFSSYYVWDNSTTMSLKIPFPSCRNAGCTKSLCRTRRVGNRRVFVGMLYWARSKGAEDCFDSFGRIEKYLIYVKRVSRLALGGSIVVQNNNENQISYSDGVLPIDRH